MDDLLKFIILKGLEKASLESIEETIREEPYLSSDEKAFWLGVLKGYSITKDAIDIFSFLSRR